MDIISLSQKHKQYVIDLRREFHKIPEPSFEEFKTSERIKQELTKLNIPFVPTSTTGIIASIEGNKKGKIVALRADIDALKITECTNISYKSQNLGFMHACGHDGHIASLLCAAKILNELKHKFNGTIRLIFQPAEENGKGSKTIINEGFLNGVDAIFGIHLVSSLDCGQISVEAGPRMASSDHFVINVKGKACHGATPSEGIDALVAASSIVMNLQSFISREINPLDPAVISVCTFSSGTSYNILAGEATLEGTVRCFSKETRSKIDERMKNIIEHTTKSYNATGNLQYNHLVSPVINNIKTTSIAQKAAEKIFSKNNIVKLDKMLIAEDFSEYLNLISGTFAFIGVRNKDKNANYPLHNDNFNIDEDCLPLSSAMHAQFALDFLNE